MELRNPNFHHLNTHGERQPRTAQIKAIQKFITKLKVDNKNYETIFTEMDGLNLSKYLEEISAIMATSVNERDLHFFTEVALA